MWPPIEQQLAQSESAEMVFVNGVLGFDAGRATARRAGRVRRRPVSYAKAPLPQFRYVA
jgi:hypothetical protein